MTLNIRGINTTLDKRYQYLPQLMRDANCDVLFLQEVHQLSADNQSNIQHFLSRHNLAIFWNTNVHTPTSSQISGNTPTPTTPAGATQSDSGNACTGVATVMHSHLAIHVCKIERDCTHRMLCIWLSFRNKTTVMLLNVYGISSPSNRDAVSAVADLLTGVSELVQQAQLNNCPLIVAGDFNINLARTRQSVTATLLRDVIHRHNLADPLYARINNPQHLATYFRTGNPTQRSYIDYFFIEQHSLHSVVECRTDSAELISGLDHIAIILRLDKPRWCNDWSVAGAHWQEPCLRRPDLTDVDKCKQFQLLLADTPLPNAVDTTLDQCAEQFTSILAHAAKQVYGMTRGRTTQAHATHASRHARRPRAPVLAQRKLLTTAIRRVTQLHLLDSHRTRAACTTSTWQLVRQVAASCADVPCPQRDRASLWNVWLIRASRAEAVLRRQEMEMRTQRQTEQSNRDTMFRDRLFDSGRYNAFIRNVEQSERQHALDTLRIDDDIVNDADGVLQAVHEFSSRQAASACEPCFELLSGQPLPPEFAPHHTNSSVDVFAALQQPITASELFEQLASMDNDKAPGYDSIHVGFLKMLPAAFSAYMLSLFNRCLAESCVPLPWKRGIRVLLPKPFKDPLQLDNLRPITLTPVIMRLFSKVLVSRLLKPLAVVLHPAQCGFLSGRGCENVLAAFATECTGGCEPVSTLVLFGAY
jgi:endonuclease/exonuclease/phosphatase family metal-dependent hydrolase